jgi:hypothetical protein
MSEQLELDPNLEDAQLELDAPAATSPAAALQGKAGSLTGALVQRGRERAPRLMETSMPIELPTPVAPGAPEVTSTETAVLAAPARSPWTDVIFAAACCVAFFATFLFVLRF